MHNPYRDRDAQALWQLVKLEADATAFAELHARFSAKLYALAYRKTGDSDVSEDLVQDLFVTLWVQKETLTIDKTINVYLFSALKNRILSHFRKQLLRNLVPLDDVYPEVLVSHSANVVQDWIQLREVQDVYLRELNNLPEKSREVFELSRSGLANKEIAEQLGLAEKTIEFHISKCLRVLRVKLLYMVGLVSALLLLH
ncbi:sigma-70 family RNA polymerase sigma factor [Larkinella rosea]|uniref:RNA polymerase sigma factor SigS n=1 Tax=Larkinella rosea TaxID=2025312 RepID=A0A3P1BM83_9BACT|nr:sigma-70 family RNA polymerase sigma factor [Larkinella rosea]RRB02152.1 sigma-70 family RNA polymerase sigma factor [Larkinella rosea]